MPRIATATDTINDTALEVGLTPVLDPVASIDESFQQLTGLLSSAGRELVVLNDWQLLRGVYEFTTSDQDTGIYDLPADFSHMIDQTGWDKSNRVSIGGPLSAQDWSYLDGRDLISQSIYASLRLTEGKLYLYPQDPVPDALDIRFEYQKRNWVIEQGTGTAKDRVTAGTDLIQYDPILIIKFLKCKFLEAKGFDASSARLEFDNMFLAITGHDTGAAILSASNNSRGFPYLSPYYNTSNTNYGGF